MIAVANSIKGPATLSEWIRDSFVDTLDTLNGVAGIERFYLRRLTGAGDNCLYVSITVWSDIAHFEVWRTSEAFQRAHPERLRHQDAFRQLRSIRYDIPITPEAPVEEIDARVLARLALEHPEVLGSGGHFAAAIDWRAPLAASPVGP